MKKRGMEMRNSKKYVNKKELKGEKEMKMCKYWLSLYVSML